MNEQLLLTDESVEELSEIVDDLKKFKNPILELVDGPAAKMAVSTLNGFTKNMNVDTVIRSELNDLIVNVRIAPKEDSLQRVTNIQNQLVDLPALDEEAEEKIFFAINGLILGLIEKRLKS